MRTLRRLTAAVLCLLLAAPALAEPLRQAPDLTGVLCWPEDAQPSEARYVFAYTYPQVEGEEETALAINRHYQDEVEYIRYYRVPMDGDDVPPGQRQEIARTYEITCSNDRFFSVLVTMTETFEGETYTVVSAQVFDRQSDKPGSLITLPHLLEILGGRETDTWLQKRQTEKANACVRAMILEQMELNPGAWLEDVDEEYLAEVIYPEEDFFLNADGNPVFFIEPGLVAPEEAGPQLFTISLEDLLDEI